MAGNSVPVFFGANARTKKPPGLDVTFISDLSLSMPPFVGFISSLTTTRALETELINQGIGVLSPNRYSFTTGGDNINNTLAEIERSVVVNGVSTRWAPGTNVLNGTAIFPNLVANLLDLTEDMGLASNLVAGTNRSYLSANQRVIIGGSDEQNKIGGGKWDTPFNLSPAFPYIYVGVHTVNLSISEPAGPNPIPSGTLVGFVYTTNTTGTAIYISGSTINYRVDVPVSNVTATAGAFTTQVVIDHARTTNGAIYNIQFFNNSSFAALGTSLGNVLGKFLFETS